MPILILGIEVTQERYPKLYRIAQTNPEGLAKTLEALSEGTDVESGAINLESDLAHG